MTVQLAKARGSDEMNMAYLKLNDPGHLAPVGCWLLIETETGIRKARRTSHIQTRERAMEYEFEDGSTITGRFRWTYP